MGLADVLGPEEKVEVKYSDFYKMIRADVERALLRNAVVAEVPREQILKMLSGRNDDLEEYKETGLSPDQIREMDRLYGEKCKEVAILIAEKDLLQKQLDETTQQLGEAEEKVTQVLWQENRNDESASL